MSTLLSSTLAAGILLGIVLGAALAGIVAPRIVYVTTTATRTVTETTTIGKTVTLSGETVTVTVRETAMHTSTTTVTRTVTEKKTTTITETEVLGDSWIDMNYLGAVVAGARLTKQGGVLRAQAHALLKLHGVLVEVNFTLTVKGLEAEACISQEQGGIPFISLPDKYTVAVAFYTGNSMVGYTKINVTTSNGTGCGESTLAKPLPGTTNRLIIVVSKR